MLVGNAVAFSQSIPLASAIFRVVSCRVGRTRWDSPTRSMAINVRQQHYSSVSPI